MEATRADLSLGVGPEIARPALRRRLAGEARHVHKKQVPRARGPQAANATRHNHRAHARQKDFACCFRENFGFPK
jgi:hypothetical protein